MLTMQYSFTLPRDYDMGIIRHRVATRGPSFDGTEHLEFKAFLISEAGKNGALDNQYAPFYLWRSEAGALDFLFGPGFAGLTADFGRPSVRTWIPLAFARVDHAAAPRFATREIVRISSGADLSDPRKLHSDGRQDTARMNGVFARVVGLDPAAWEIVTFTLWSGAVDAATLAKADTARYEVLHLSEGPAGEAEL